MVLYLLLLAVLSSCSTEFSTEENSCGTSRPSGLPDPGAGTCNDVGKCCEWTWPPMLTGTVSCDTTTKDNGCYGCEPPSCCCAAGTLTLKASGGQGVGSCCDCYYTEGPNKGK